ncbi:O-antigen translocase [Myxococcota bacterium]|nr:O-antigen translocase [Myxococcota bacterium]
MDAVRYGDLRPMNEESSHQDESSDPDESSYRRILGTSAVIGAASAVNIVTSIGRVKVLALILGPVGMGLLGMYNTLMSTSGSIAAMGFRYSAVREIASQISAGNEQALADLRAALRYVTFLMGLLGAIVVYLLAGHLSEWTFGDRSHSTPIAILSIGVGITVLAGAQTGLLSGYRDIAGLAYVTVLGALSGAVLATVLVWRLGDAGIPYVVVGLVGLPLLVALYFTTRQPRPTLRPRFSGTLEQSWKLARLGIVAMSSSFMLSLGVLTVRSLIIRELGEEANGFFQAAYGLSLMSVGILLTSMDADFYPRVSEKIAEPRTAERLVNEQAEVCFLLAGPAFLGMLTFAPLLINLLYSSDFVPATALFRWFSIGLLFKITAWPLAIYLLSLSARRWILVSEASWNVLYVLFVWFWIEEFGLATAGVGYLVAQVWYLFIQFVAVRTICGFRWSRVNISLVAVYVTLSVGVLAASSYSAVLGYALGAPITVAAGVYGVRSLGDRAGISGAPRKLIERAYRMMFSGRR